MASVKSGARTTNSRGKGNADGRACVTGAPNALVGASHAVVNNSSISSMFLWTLLLFCGQMALTKLGYMGDLLIFCVSLYYFSYTLFK